MESEGYFSCPFRFSCLFKKMLFLATMHLYSPLASVLQTELPLQPSHSWTQSGALPAPLPAPAWEQRQDHPHFSKQQLHHLLARSSASYQPHRNRSGPPLQRRGRDAFPRVNCHKWRAVELLFPRQTHCRVKRHFAQCWGMGSEKVEEGDLSVTKPHMLQGRVSSILAWHQVTWTTVARKCTHPGMHRERDVGMIMP